MDNMLTAYDVVKAGSAGYNEGQQRIQTAAEMAAYGDAAQTNRIQNRLARMVAETGIDEQQKDAKWKQSVANMLTGVPATSPSPAAVTPGGPPAFTPPSFAPSSPMTPGGPPVAPPAPPTREALVNGGLQNDMVRNGLMTPPPAPGAPPPTAGIAAPPAAPPQAPGAPADPYAAILQATSPGGQLYQQDPVRALALNDEVKAKKSTDTWNQIKIGIETNKITAEQQKQLQEKMEPIIRATTPVFNEYQKLLAGGMPADKAAAAVQPHYEQMIKAVSQIPGYEQAAAGAPKKFNPALTYLAADTYKMLGTQQTAKEKEAAKLDEQKPTGDVTPKGHIVFRDGHGKLFVDGKPYTGSVVKPKVGVVGGVATGVGTASNAFAKGDQAKANEALTQIWLMTGKVSESAFGRGSKPEIQARRDHFYANLQKVADDAHTTLPALMAGTADVKAAVASMVKQRAKITNMEASEVQAEKNLTRLEGLYDKLGNGTIPLLNDVQNRFAKHLGAPAPGTAEAVAYETMIEYTRVVTQQTTGAPPTDSAMKNTAELISVLKDNPAQLKAKFTQFRGLMKDSLVSQHTEYDALKAGVAAGVQAAPQTPAQAPAPAGLNYNPSDISAELARRGIK